jgi:hypothetical protein
MLRKTNAYRIATDMLVVPATTPFEGITHANRLGLQGISSCRKGSGHAISGEICAINNFAVNDSDEP